MFNIIPDIHYDISTMKDILKTYKFISFKFISYHMSMTSYMLNTISCMTVIS